MWERTNINRDYLRALKDVSTNMIDLRYWIPYFTRFTDDEKRAMQKALDMVDDIIKKLKDGDKVCRKE